MLSRGQTVPTCWDGLTCQTAPTSKNDENVGVDVGVMDNMLAKPATSMSNRPNMLRQHVGTVCPRLYFMLTSPPYIYF